MRALASGPFGILVMVVPLVAIPILSTFGIPQFAPLVAATSGTEEDVDIVPARSDDDAFADLQAASPHTKPESRTADDLFAPLDAPRAAPRARPLADRSSPRSTEAEASSGLVPLIPPAQPKRSAQLPGRRRSDSSEADPAMSGWDAVPVGEAFPDNSEPSLESPAPNVENLTPQERVPSTPRNDKGLRMPREFESDQPAPAAAPAPETTTGELTWKGAQKRLNEFGIHKFVLESPRDGGFQFRCAVTDPDNPQVDRQFLTRADEPLLAVERALEQIESFRAGR